MTRICRRRSVAAIGAAFAAVVAVGLTLALPAGAATPDQVVVSESPAKRTPNVVDGQVSAIVQIGNTIVVGGSFTKVKEPGGSTFTRSHIFAFDATTFAVDRNFAPTIDREVLALAPGDDGKSVIAGGRFNTVNGQGRKGLVKLDLATGQRMTFAARPQGAVFDLARHASRLYIAGNFSKMSGNPIAVLAAVNATTGAVDLGFHPSYSQPRSTSTITGNLFVEDLAVTPDGTRLITSGNFQRVDGLDRNQLAVLDLTTSPVSVANWQTDRYKFACPSQRHPSWLTDVAVSPDGTWFSAVSTGAYAKGQLCDTATRWDLTQTGNGLQPTWVDYTGGDSLFSVAVTKTAVYVGGHQRWQNNPFAGDAPGPGAVPRSGIAALDTVNGLPLSWNPGRSPRGLGVFALVPTATGLWVGSDTNYIDGVYRAKIAFMPTAGGKALPAALPGTLPGQIFALGLDGGLRKRAFDGSTAGAPSTVATGVDWSHGRGAFMLSGRLYTGWDDGNLYVRTFDGSVLGSPAPVDLHGLTNAHFPLASVTGMFFDPARNRLYYSVAGTARMFFRYFTPESEVVGAETFVASGESDGLAWGTVAGMTLASNWIYFSRSDGRLRKTQFSAGVPVPGTETVVSNTGDWASRGLFILSAP